MKVCRWVENTCCLASGDGYYGIFFKENIATNEYKDEIVSLVLYLLTELNSATEPLITATEVTALTKASNVPEVIFISAHLIVYSPYSLALACDFTYQSVVVAYVAHAEDTRYSG